jgi:hypothetical protein
MGSSSDSRISALKSFLKGHPEIEYATPNSPNYSKLRVTYRLNNPAVPFAIVRPQNADDVAAIVKYARANGIKPVVRSGGNSLFGKSSKHKKALRLSPVIGISFALCSISCTSFAPSTFQVRKISFLFLPKHVKMESY